MRISDIRVSATAVFCCLSALAIGCGDSSTKTVADAAAEAARDFPDTAVDSAKDSPSSDSAADAARADLSLDAFLDGASSDGAVDANRADSPQSDAAQVDGMKGAEVGGDGGDAGAPSTMATVTFRFKNTGASTLYVRQACSIFIRVTSLVDGRTYGTNSSCACDCASPSCNGNLECGACAPASGVPIPVGSAHDIAWVAQFTTSQLKTGSYGSFQCVSHSPIPTGPYKVEISLYATDADAINETNSRKLEQTFTLGTANATVEVPIQ